MDANIEVLAHQLADILKSKKLILSTAESCTGGGLSFYLTSIPGSTAWFDRGFVTYSNNAKVEMLKVDPDVLKTFGAVSEESAREMALGAIEQSKADLSIAITGIAGPDGGTLEKPVGTVWIAFAKKNEDIQIECFHFEGNRATIRDQSIGKALSQSISWLQNK